MACGGGCCVESTLKLILNQTSELNPSLRCLCQLVPIFERADIQTRGEEEADCVGDELFVGLRILTEQRFLAHSSMRRKRTSGALAADVGLRKMWSLASRLIGVGCLKIRLN